MTSPLRDRLRARLTEAVRARDRDLVGALRSTLGALDNAEAVPVADGDTAPTGGGPQQGSEHVAGANAGVGSAEVERRTLTQQQEEALVGQEVAELRAAAQQYAGLGHDERAATATRTAASIATCLSTPR